MLIKTMNLFSVSPPRRIGMFLPYYNESRLNRCYSSFQPFSLLKDELTLDVKEAIERKWWDKVYGPNCIAQKEGIAQLDQSTDRKKTYILSMFPYPSGKLHLGHVRVYTLSDAIARYHRLKGDEVIHPIGWDAFGLPAENAARDHGVEPGKWTKENIHYMKEQLIRMGCSFDWNRELSTCDPAFYKWTQWLFLKLWENGLAYKKKAYVFWDPVDQTVLAEEQVDSEMRSWRSGAKVEKRLLDQWFIRTSVFARDLSDGLKHNALRLGWRDIVDMQKNWIGKIQGYFTDCQLATMTEAVLLNGEFLRLWYASPENLMEAKFVILNPNHYMNHSPDFILQTFANGVKQLNVFLRNPVTGTILPIFCSTQNNELPVVPESSDCRICETLDVAVFGELAETEIGLHLLNEVLSSAKIPLHDPLPRPNQLLFFPASLKLRDWLISRQRKWGTPIPAINCLDCGHDTVLPSTHLPHIVNANQLQEHPITSNTSHRLNAPSCSHCGSNNTKQETDTLDTFFDSTWYFLRYLDSANETDIFDPDKVKSWFPVSKYIGGKEHATLHLYYARFMSHFLHKLGLVPEKEPFKVLIPMGFVMGEAFCTASGKYIRRDEVEENAFKKLVEKKTKLPVTSKWEKMSKSKLNGIDPDTVLCDYGLDSTRLLTLADVAPQSPRKWPSESFAAYLKFQTKIWLTVRDFVVRKEKEEDDFIKHVDEDMWQRVEEELFDVRNYHLKSVTFNMESASQVSVAITKMHGMVTALRKIPKTLIKESLQFERTMGTLLITLYPIMPAFAAQLWQYFRDVAKLTQSEFNLDKEVWCQKWPDVDRTYRLDLIVYFHSEEIEIVKVARHVLDSLDVNLALDFAFDTLKVMQLIPREHVKVLTFAVEPGYRAVLNIRDSRYSRKPELITGETSPKKKHRAPKVSR